MPKDTFLTLTPLPGGNSQYVETIDKMLEFFEGDIARTRNEFIAWAIAEFSVSRTSVNAYIQTLALLNLIERKQHRRLVLTDKGQSFLRTLNPEIKSEILLGELLPRFIGMFDVLLLVANAGDPISLDELTEYLIKDFPDWSTGEPIAKRLYWLLALGCIQQVGSRRSSYVARLFGREMIRKFRSEVETAGSVHLQHIDHPLLQKVRWAAQYTATPRQFETAVGKVFEFLGYQVSYFGGSGETDLLVKAPLGSASYSFIVDTKSRYDGKLYDVDSPTIHKHRRSAGADFAVLIAEEFGGSSVQQYAVRNQLVLIPLSLLEEWVFLHESTPLHLLNYRPVVENPGQLTKLPEQVIEHSHFQQRRFLLLSRLILFFQQAYAVNPDIKWTNNQLYSHLAMEYNNEQYSQKEVDDAVAFLGNPMVGGVVHASNEIILGMKFSTISQVIHNLITTLTYHLE
jgi:hypothetical protein